MQLKTGPPADEKKGPEQMVLDEVMEEDSSVQDVDFVCFSLLSLSLSHYLPLLIFAQESPDEYEGRRDELDSDDDDIEVNALLQSLENKTNGIFCFCIITIGNACCR